MPAALLVTLGSMHGRHWRFAHLRLPLPCGWLPCEAWPRLALQQRLLPLWQAAVGSSPTCIPAPSWHMYRSCCHMYRRSDYASQLEAGRAAAGLPDKNRRRRRLSWDSCSSAGSDTSPGGGGNAGSALSRLSPEQRMASLSLRHKFQAAGLVPGANPRARAAEAGLPGGSDTFRIGTATYPAAAASQAAQQQQELGPVVLPSAPPLAGHGPSTRSLPAVHRPRQWGTWAAATAAQPAAAAGSSRSAPGSALNSARSASGVQLLPAVEALSPKAQAELPRALSLGVPSEQAAPSPLQPAASSSSTGGSALQRAGSALARLKLLSRRNS